MGSFKQSAKDDMQCAFLGVKSLNIYNVFFSKRNSQDKPKTSNNGYLHEDEWKRGIASLSTFLPQF